MLLNDTVAEEVYFAYRKAQVKGMETDRLPCIHVSDLIKPCMRNVIYGRVGKPDMTSQEIKSMFIGQAIHAITDLSTRKEDHEKLLIYDWINDEGYHSTAQTTSKKTSVAEELKKRPYDFISGSIDDIVWVDNEPIIVDKKTTGSIEYFHKRDSTANDSHRLQINCYRVLLEKCFNIKAKKGCVVYIPNSVSKENKITHEPIAIAFSLTKPEEVLNMMITNAQVIKDSMDYTKRTLPGRTKNFLCDGLCPFATKCFTDERKRWDE